jgi:hypothetical protein
METLKKKNHILIIRRCITYQILVFDLSSLHLYIYESIRQIAVCKCASAKNDFMHFSFTVHATVISLICEVSNNTIVLYVHTCMHTPITATNSIELLGIS